ncbi:hypothetical protein CFOL_v3_04029, partial [Cephalotus follicularis]
LIQWPVLLRSEPKKRDSDKYFQYHRDHEHDTEECRHLKNHIEDLIRKGHLHKYVDRSRKAYARKTFAVQQYQHRKRWKTSGDEKVISFSEVDYDGVRIPHNDPVVVTLQVELFTMKRILIDSGSSTDILHKHAFDQLRIPANQLKPVKTPLIGF